MFIDLCEAEIINIFNSNSEYVFSLIERSSLVMAGEKKTGKTWLKFCSLPRYNKLFLDQKERVFLITDIIDRQSSGILIWNPCHLHFQKRKEKEQVLQLGAFYFVARIIKNYLLKQLKNVLHSCSYGLRNGYRTCCPFRSEIFFRWSRQSKTAFVHRTWPLIHIYVLVGSPGYKQYERSLWKQGSKTYLVTCWYLVYTRINER